MLRTSLVGIAAALMIAACAAPASAQLTNAFTYQGQLGNAGAPVSGNVDLQFQLYSAATGGAAIGSLATQTNVPVSNGLFTTSVDLGVNPYTSFQQLYLQVAVRNPAGSGSYVTMSARQPITATPFSLATRGLTVDAAGRVGIGRTPSIFMNLDFPMGSIIGSSDNNGVRGVKVAFGYKSGGNVSCDQFAGIKIASNPGTNGCGDSNDVLFFTEECNTSCSREVMRVNGRGNVGIGTATPTQARLVVNGNSATSLSNFWYMNGTGTGGPSSSGTWPMSIYASDAVVGSQFFAFSDARLKHIQGRSDASHDLETLMSVQVTDYTFKDTVAKGTGAQKKLIAQQVEQVYPAAVRRSTDVVPDIYQRATVRDGWLQLATDLKVHDRVRLIGATSQTVCEVVDVRGDAFRPASLPDGDEIFVYGREVDDARSVDYEAIAMLNVSATQELARQNLAQQKRIDELEARLKAAIERFEAAPTGKLAATR